MKIKLGVIFGGKSVEHEVSIVSALLAIENIDREKYEVIPIYVNKENQMFTSNKFLNIENFKDFDNITKNATKVDIELVNNNIFLKQKRWLFPKLIDVDIFYPIVHGAGVEDGTIQGYLDFKKVPYVGSSVLASAVGQDKVIFKDICIANNVPVLDYKVFYDFDLSNTKNIIEEVSQIGFPVIIKPSTLGSSVGISVAKTKDELIEKMSEAFKYDYKVLIEKKINTLREVNISLLGDEKEVELSAIEEIITKNEIYTYDDKYMGKSNIKNSKYSGNRKIPAKLSSELQEEIESISKKIFKISSFSGIVRFDFLIDKDNNKVYFNEPNTIPGSLSYHLWNGKGYRFNEVLDKSIQIAIDNYKRKEGKIRSFETNILGIYGNKGMKGKLK